MQTRRVLKHRESRFAPDPAPRAGLPEDSMKEAHCSSLKGLDGAKKLSDLSSHYEQDVAKLVNDAILLRRGKATRSVLCRKRSHASALQRGVVEKVEEGIVGGGGCDYPRDHRRAGAPRRGARQ